MDLGYISGPENLPETVQHGKTPKSTMKKSRNGHVAYLIVICASTKYIWAFPLKSAAPPIELIDQFLTRHGQAHRRNTTLVTTSPEGILAKSKTFQTLLETKTMQLQHQDLAIDFDTLADRAEQTTPAEETTSQEEQSSKEAQVSKEIDPSH
eukprot:scaffold14746_cov176-Cylindrotheca_fusiformis.AAC.1